MVEWAGAACRLTPLPGAQVALAARAPQASYVAAPAASWLDDFLAWVSPEVPRCCRAFPAGRGGGYCPPPDQPPCNASAAACAGCAACFRAAGPPGPDLLVGGRPSLEQVALDPVPRRAAPGRARRAACRAARLGALQGLMPVPARGGCWGARCRAAWQASLLHIFFLFFFCQPDSTCLAGARAAALVPGGAAVGAVRQGRRGRLQRRAAARRGRADRRRRPGPRRGGRLRVPHLVRAARHAGRLHRRHAGARPQRRPRLGARRAACAACCTWCRAREPAVGAEREGKAGAVSSHCGCLLCGWPPRRRLGAAGALPGTASVRTTWLSLLVCSCACSQNQTKDLNKGVLNL
jgi:hypothetical protein